MRKVDPNVPKTLPAPLLDIARHCLRRDPARRWTLADIAKRLNPPLAAQRTEKSVQQSAAPRNIWYLIAALIVLLASIGLVSRRLLKESPRSDAPIPQATEKISKKSPPEPRPVASAAPAEKKSEPPVASAAPAEKKSEPPIEKPATPSIEKPTTSAPATDRRASSARASAKSSRSQSRQQRRNSPSPARCAAKVPGYDPRHGEGRHQGERRSVRQSYGCHDRFAGTQHLFCKSSSRCRTEMEICAVAHRPSDWTLRFEFTPDGTQAFAEQSAP